MIDYIAQYMDEWFVDTLDKNVYNIMAETAAKYSKENFVKATVETFETLLKNRIQKLEEIKANINE
jgi:hypothetical protein